MHAHFPSSVLQTHQRLGLPSCSCVTNYDAWGIWWTIDIILVFLQQETAPTMCFLCLQLQGANNMWDKDARQSPWTAAKDNVIHSTEDIIESMNQHALLNLVHPMG